ncbi:hypothetical protein [Microbispora hainanensis]|uniref:hypothetical protein n=1 Tax=Microbispora hainanensis TaxID=568844 RepID=UPI00142ED309|nr:hypothetical protein [Microbispora hainanensis]
MDNAETDGQVDYESIRRRFPWVGHGPDEEHEFSTTCRDVLAGAGWPTLTRAPYAE